MRCNYLTFQINRRSRLVVREYDFMNALRNAFQILPCEALPHLAAAALNSWRLYGGDVFFNDVTRVGVH